MPFTFSDNQLLLGNRWWAHITAARTHSTTYGIHEKVYQLFDFAINTRHISHEKPKPLMHSVLAQNWKYVWEAADHSANTCTRTLYPSIDWFPLYSQMHSCSESFINMYFPHTHSRNILFLFFFVQPRTKEWCEETWRKNTIVQLTLQSSKHWPQYVRSATAKSEKSFLSTFNSSDVNDVSTDNDDNGGDRRWNQEQNCTIEKPISQSHIKATADSVIDIVAVQTKFDIKHARTSRIRMKKMKRKQTPSPLPPLVHSYFTCKMHQIQLATGTTI